MTPDANNTSASNIGRWGPCLHCGGPKPCKPCTRIRQQRWADEKRDRVRIQKKAYEEKYPERVIASKAANYERNHVRYAARAKALRAADPEARRIEERQRYAKNPEPYKVRNTRRQERDRVVGGFFTQEDRCALFVSRQGMCANVYCQADLSVSGFHADHVIPVLLGGGHGIENRQLLCRICNHRKGALTNEEFLSRQRKEVACA